METIIAYFSPVSAALLWKTLWKMLKTPLLSTFSTLCSFILYIRRYVYCSFQKHPLKKSRRKYMIQIKQK